MDKLLCTPEGHLLNLPWDPVVLEMYTWNGIHTTERGEKAGVLYIPQPQSASSCIAVPPLLVIVYGTHDQGKFLKLPISCSSRPRGHILFSTGAVI